MRAISAALDLKLQSGVLTTAYLIALTRNDGTFFGFTDADRDIVWGGHTYESSDGVGATAISQTAGTGIDNFDLQGFLTSDRITEEDLAAGLFDGAKIEVYQVDRLDLDAGSAHLHSGFLGEVQTVDGAFRVTVRGLSQRASFSTGESTCETCWARRLGDLQCKKSLAGNSGGGLVDVPIHLEVTVSQVLDSFTFIVDDNPGGPDVAAGQGTWANGYAVGLTGGNEGFERTVKSQDVDIATGYTTVTLRQPWPRALQVGDTIRMELGCDRTYTVCDTWFANANNFHAQERLPTNDKITKVGR